MGYIKHHAIVVVGWDGDRLGKAHDKAKEIGCMVSEIVGPGVNGYCSFLVAPDGSKEGWEESDSGDSRRDQLVEYLAADEDSYCEWAEIVIGPDDQAAYVPRHAWKAQETTG